MKEDLEGRKEDSEGILEANLRDLLSLLLSFDLRSAVGV